MNEKIIELSLEAREFATVRHPISDIVLSINNDIFVQKFAELIIDECCNQVRYIDAISIKDHFGIGG